MTRWVILFNSGRDRNWPLYYIFCCDLQADSDHNKYDILISNCLSPTSISQFIRSLGRCVYVKEGFYILILLKPHNHQHLQTFIFHNLYTPAKIVFKRLGQIVTGHGHPSVAVPSSWKQAHRVSPCAGQDQLAGTVQGGVHGIHERFLPFHCLKCARPHMWGRCTHPIKVWGRGSVCTGPAAGPWIGQPFGPWALSETVKHLCCRGEMLAWLTQFQLSKLHGGKTVLKKKKGFEVPELDVCLFPQQVSQSFVSVLSPPFHVAHLLNRSWHELQKFSPLPHNKPLLLPMPPLLPISMEKASFLQGTPSMACYSVSVRLWIQIAQMSVLVLPFF